MNQLSAINHIVVLMLENRSFDHMLGFLYQDRKNVSLAGQPFDGLTGAESNLDANGKAVKVFPITLRHAECVLHAGGRSRRRLCGDQRPAVRQPNGAGASRGDQCRLRDRLCIDTRLGIQEPGLFGAARDRPVSDHGHLYAGRPCRFSQASLAAMRCAISGSARRRPRPCRTARLRTPARPRVT